MDEAITMIMYGTNMDTGIAGLSACALGVIFQSNVLFVIEHFTASMMAQTTQGQRAS
jgi:hypothetical protein